MSALDHQEGGTHYAKLKIQPIEYIHANGLGFSEGSVIKYVTRWRDKNGIADLKKARHFLDLLIELEEKNHIVEVNEKDHHKAGSLSEFIQNAIDKSEDAIQASKAQLAAWDVFKATQPQWVEDKELPSSGIYGEQGYTEDDLKAASLVHDCELDPDLVSLCSNTEIHADADGWHVHVGNECPVSDGDTHVEIKTRGGLTDNDAADYFEWNCAVIDSIDHIAKWRFAK